MALVEDGSWRSLFKVESIDKSDMDSNRPGEIQTKEYDQVIIAAPLVKSILEIEFDGFLRPIRYDQEPYQRTVATFVQGRLNRTSFGCSETKCDDVEEVLTVGDSLFYNSIGRGVPINFDPTLPKSSNLPVYKVFSKEPLVKSQIDTLFTEYLNVKIVDWLAYPQYSPPEYMLPFALHLNMFYVNAIERAASCMETAVVGAKNVALLSYYNWMKEQGMVNARFDRSDRYHSEL